MSEANGLAELLLFETLDAGIDGEIVYQDAPATAKLPLVIIGDLDSVPYGATDDPDRLITVAIITLTDGDERAPCLALQHQVEQLLGGQSLPIAGPIYGWTMHCSIERSTAAIAEAGGYEGTTIVRILAFRDD